MGDWAAKNGSKRSSRWSTNGRPAPRPRPPSSSASPRSAARSSKSIRIPLANPDFAPFLQRIRDINPDTAFIYFPGTQAAIFAKQFAERGLAKSGITIIGPGDLTDDDELNGMGDQMLGIVTAHILFRVAPLGPEQGVRRRRQEGEQFPRRTSSRSAATTACT